MQSTVYKTILALPLHFHHNININTLYQPHSSSSHLPHKQQSTHLPTMRAILSLIITLLFLAASFTQSAPVDPTSTTSSPSPSASEDPFPLPAPAIIGGGDEPSDGFVYLCQWAGFLQCYKYTWVAQKCSKSYLFRFALLHSTSFRVTRSLEEQKLTNSCGSQTRSPRA